MFGPILSCDILLDAMGRPLNEAEIEFLYPNSAEECVAKLDNGMADGKKVKSIGNLWIFY
jgi:RNA recognition motif-containing protein